MDDRKSIDLLAITGPTTVADIHEKKTMGSQTVLNEKNGKLTRFDPKFASTLHHLVAAGVASAGLWGTIVATLDN